MSHTSPRQCKALVTSLPWPGSCPFWTIVRGKPQPYGLFVVARRMKLSARILRVLEIAEDAIHLLVAALVIGLAVMLVGDLVGDALAAVRGEYAALQTVLVVLDKALVLFIVAELLHTVRITIQHHGSLDAGPFLVIGLVAAVRRVLILTAEAEVSFQWNPQGIELTVMVGLILALAVSIVIWRRSKAIVLGVDDAGDGVDRGREDPGAEQV
jgi:uncharacterized membrane protein (DUF373 family)